LAKDPFHQPNQLDAQPVSLNDADPISRVI